MKITVLPAAEQDVAEAAAFYEEVGSDAVAAKFVAEFKRVAHVLLEFPAIGSPRTQGRRGFSLSLFPYAIVYRQTKDGTTILVVKHDRRRPKCGAQRRRIRFKDPITGAPAAAGSSSAPAAACPSTAARCRH